MYDSCSREDTFSTTVEKSLQQYQISLPSSNTTSNIILNNVWTANSKLLTDLIAESLPLDAENTSHIKHWKTSLSECDPIALLEQSLPMCDNCSKPNYFRLEEFQKHICKCDPGLFGTSNKLYNDNTHYNKENSLLKPKFGHSRNFNKNISLSSNNIQEPEIDITKIEEDEKTHKSNVAKITFKSAKEQLLASNPAARRTLGTSRKAQAKFVSPMIGAQLEKQDSQKYLDVTDDRLKHIDPKMIELIENEIIDKGAHLTWDDIAGLQLAKSVIQEAVVWPLLRPDIFTGLRRPPKGILLFGPPGTGKTLIGKCVASQCKATFFSISASSLTSKWIGDGEKMVRALFAVARCHQPAVIFIDEIDSLLTQRSDTEHEASRRIKTEFLVQFDGAATGDEDRLLIVGATNRPQELDEAARRRLVKRLYIPLPDEEARRQIICNLLMNERHSMTANECSEVARQTDGYSGADMRALCAEAAMGPVRALPLSQITTIQTAEVRPVCLQDFVNALQRVKPSVSQNDLGQYVKWNNTYGQGF